MEWERDGAQCIGIIDCNIYNSGIPILDELKARRIRKIDFILLTHMHYDHYSGMGYLLEYIIEQKIQVDSFYHTFAQDYLFLFDRSNISQKTKDALERFIKKFEEALGKHLITNLIGSVDHNCIPRELFGAVKLKILTPNGNDYFEFSQCRIQNKGVDPNRIATIATISDDKEAILLTSDAAIKSFKRIAGKLNIPMIMVQVPHHGSRANLHREFWVPLNKTADCPAVYSVGEIKKDKLPNLEVVQFLHEQGFFNTSTNYVYGIKEYYPLIGPPSEATTYTAKAEKNIASLLPFAVSVRRREVLAPSRFMGDKTFEFF